MGNFEGINLEDIKAPECFAIEEQLNDLQKLPVFHDDQHGTAIVVLAGLINAVKVVEKDLHQCKVLVNGAGASGIAITKLLLHYGVKDIIVCDSKGAIYKDRKEGMNSFKQQIAEATNAENIKGKLKDVIEGRDIFIGVSQEKALRGHWAAKMAQKYRARGRQCAVLANMMRMVKRCKSAPAAKALACSCPTLTLE